MPISLDQLLRQYDYAFPSRAIAQAPASPRDSARLLILSRRTGAVSFDVFQNIGAYLPPRSVLVLNETRVLPARLAVRKETGGMARILYLGNDGEHVSALSDRTLRVGSRVLVSPRRSFLVVGRRNETYTLFPSFSANDIESVLHRFGEVPLPPYITKTPLAGKRLRDAYQSVFAKRIGSVAAPTASLHFTKRLLRKLERSGISIRYVTLHVGLGTFLPVREEQLRSGRLHRERFSIDAKTASFLNTAKKDGRPIIAVGTTVTRTLESAAEGRGRITRRSGETDLFIREGYHFSFVDGMVTNFHVPKSSLLMLVSAFAGRKKILSAYESTIQDGFRLFSFGDGMLLL